jgi:hypothetical protein
MNRRLWVALVSFCVVAAALPATASASQAMPSAAETYAAAGVAVGPRAVAVPAVRAERPVSLLALPAALSGTTAVFGWSRTSITSAVGYGLPFRVTVKVGATAAPYRTVVLQAMAPGTSAWRSVSSTKTDRYGQATGRLSVTRTGTWRFRLKVPATAVATAITTGARTITGVVGSPSSLSGWSTTTMPVIAARTTTVKVKASPASSSMKRSVRVQVWNASTKKWSTTATRTSDGAGVALVPLAAPATGYRLTRLVVLPTRIHAGLTTKSRRISAAAPPAPADLTALVGSANVEVSWGSVLTADVREYQLWSAAAPTGPWTEVLTQVATQSDRESVTVPFPAGQGPAWFAVSADDAYGHRGTRSLPIGLASKWVPSGVAAAVAADGFELAVPSTAVMGTGARISVVSHRTGSSAVRSAALHIAGDWTGKVKVTAPWAAGTGNTPVLLHYTDDTVLISSGSGLATSGTPGNGTISTEVSTLSEFTSLTEECDKYGAGEAAPYFCGDKDTVDFRQWWNQRAEDRANALRGNLLTTPCGAATGARAIGYLPVAMTCTMSSSADGSALVTLTNDSDSKYGLLASALVYRYTLNGDPTLATAGRQAPPGTPALLSDLAGEYATRSIPPGASLTFRKTKSNDEARVDLGADVLLSGIWFGIEEVTLLFPDSASEEVLVGVYGTRLATCLALPSSSKEDIALCLLEAMGGFVGFATAKLEEQEQLKKLDPKRESALAKLKVAGRLLKLVDLVLFVNRVGSIFSQTQTGAALYVKNGPSVDVPTGRGGSDYIARSPGSGRAVHVSNGQVRWIQDGGTFNCLAASRVVWDLGALRDLDKVPVGNATCSSAGSNWTFTPSASGGNTGTSVILRESNGTSWLVNKWGDIQWIPDGGTYLCLAYANPVLWSTPRDKALAWLPRGGEAASCGSSSPSARELWGGIAAVDADGSSWYVDLRGARHWVPDTTVFSCLANQGLPVYRGTTLSVINSFAKGPDAACVRAAVGDVVRTSAGKAYLVVEGSLRSITNGETYECLVGNQGRKLVDNVPTYWVDDRGIASSITLSCFDPAAAKGKVVRTPAGTSYYVDLRGGRHWIPDGGVYECLIAQGKALVDRIPQFYLDAMPQYENAACVRANPGNVIRHANGDAYLINADWSRSWIPTAATYQCVLSARTLVDGVPRYYIDDLTVAANASVPTGNCIIRRPDGKAFFVNNEGKREWIPDSPTWDCEVGRGVPVYGVTDAFANGLTEVGWHYCLNKANLRGKILRHADGDASYIQADDTRKWIPDQFTYSCLTNRGTPVVNTLWREYVTAFPDKGWMYCFDINTFTGQHIAHTAGDHHIVGWDGRRHWIPDAATLQCINNRYGAAKTVLWREYITAIPEGDWAVCGDTLKAEQKLDRGQWLASSDGRYKLHMQTDGNLVLYNAAGTAIWATNRTGSHLKLHSGGCLAEVDYALSWIWTAANSCNSGANRLVVQSDGNLVLYSPTRAVWASNTVGR